MEEGVEDEAWSAEEVGFRVQGLVQPRLRRALRMKPTRSRRIRMATWYGGEEEEELKKICRIVFIGYCRGTQGARG